MPYLVLTVQPSINGNKSRQNKSSSGVGKPSPDFFQLALDDMGVTVGDCMMVGDDIDADIGGAQGARLKAVQVRTGKFTEADLEHPSVRPDFRIDSIAALPDLIRDMV